jgi:Kelch motif
MDNAVGELDGRVYSVGGVDGHDIIATGCVYDPALLSWQPIADLPAPRQNAAGMFVGDTFYVTGGWDYNTCAAKTTFAYDPAANSWRSVADAPAATAAAQGGPPLRRARSKCRPATGPIGRRFRVWTCTPRTPVIHDTY